MSNVSLASEDADDDVEDGNVQELEIKSIIGFDGTTIAGLIVHPDGKHLVYPLGNKVTIQEWRTKTQQFLTGHTNIISAVNVSKSGKFIASGQINHIGFRASVIVWDFETKSILSKHDLHKVRVEAVSFSSDEQFCLSLGGRDCGSVVVWDIVKSQIVCGAAASHGTQGEATALKSMTRRGVCFMTAGDNHLAVWKIDRDARNVRSIDVNTSKLKRSVLCIDINERDEICYCGTTTGDILKIRLNYHHDPDILDPVKRPVVIGCFARISKKKLPKGQVDLYGQGVKSILLLFGGAIIVGAGDGTVDLVEESKPKIPKDVSEGVPVKLPSTPALKVLKTANVKASVTSIQLMTSPKGEKLIFAGTTNCEIFALKMDDFTCELLVTCHTSPIYDLAFPRDFSEVFASAGKNEVRIWSTKTNQELLRICVPNFSCSSVLFTHDGKAVLSAWNDGVIRSFTPLTGRLIYAILNAHNKGVSALEVTRDGQMLVSGGCEGQVRLWSISPIRQQLICTLKEHKAPISSIHLNNTDTEAVSASTDGTCIIWDLKRQCRRQILFSTTLFMCARYYPTGVQVVTGGSDRKLMYWEVLDGSMVREVDGSRSGAINTLDISEDGEIFVTGGNDQIVKLWKYQQGITTHIGLGHSSVVTCTKFSPDGQLIVSASGSGSIFIWKCPITPEKDDKSRIDEDGDKKDILNDGEEIVDDLVSRKSGSVKQTNVCVCVCPK